LTPDDPLRAGELMVHLIESDDASHVARVYADLPKSSPGLVGAMQELGNSLLISIPVVAQGLRPARRHGKTRRHAANGRAISHSVEGKNRGLN
jgi:hypothetical protein